MLKTILSISVAAILLVSILAISETQARSYKINWKINFADKESLLCTDEIYVRDTNAEPDKNGEHKILLAKITIENPSQQSYSITKTFDPKKASLFDKLMRDYLLLEWLEAVIYKNYKHPFTQFKKDRYSYTFTYNIPHLSCPQQNQDQEQQSQSLRFDDHKQEQYRPHIVKVPRGDQNNQ